MMKQKEAMKEIKISFIVPIYNVEEYLERCLDSICNQTYQNIEIILVNDGSTDKSEEICKKYLLKDKRIKYIKKNNGGVSSARNVGIENTTGEYICFVDSDDYINEKFAEIFLNVLLCKNSDIVICDYEKVFRLENIQKNILNLENVYNVDSINVISDLLEIPRKGIITNHMWNKIFKKELFDNIRFPQGKNFEDIGVFYLLVNKAKNISVIPNKLYYYYERKNSIMGTLTEKSMRDKISIVNERHEFIENNYPSLIKKSESYILKNNIYIQKELIKKYGEKVIFNEMYCYLRNEILNNYDIKTLNVRERILLIFIKINDKLMLNMLRKILKKKE